MGEKDAVVLLSGGLDSTTVVAIARSQGYRVHALSFDYGQNHKVELEGRGQRSPHSWQVARAHRRQASICGRSAAPR